ncbi:MAG: hypothetical protein IT267_09950 [Saprospiraceae bacterium]|nr:hypothetical protein [Saprospiraceae bacterium]
MKSIITSFAVFVCCFLLIKSCKKTTPDFVPQAIIEKSIQTFDSLIDQSNYKLFGFLNEKHLDSLSTRVQIKKYILGLDKINLNNNSDVTLDSSVGTYYDIIIPLVDTIRKKLITAIEFGVNDQYNWVDEKFGASSLMVSLIKLYNGTVESELNKKLQYLDFDIIEVPALNTGILRFSEMKSGIETHLYVLLENSAGDYSNLNNLNSNMINSTSGNPFYHTLEDKSNNELEAGDIESSIDSLSNKIKLNFPPLNADQLIKSLVNRARTINFNQPG